MSLQQKTLVLCLFALPGFAFVGMSASKKTDDKIPYELARNYFVKNSYPDDGVFEITRITSRAQFDEIFEAAAFMGENGKPTPLDFEKEDVIAFIGYTSDLVESLDLYSLTRQGDSILLGYSSETLEEPRSYSTRPAILIVVDKKYQGELHFLRFEKIDGTWTSIPGSDGDEYGCLASGGYTWSKLLKDCIRVWEVGTLLQPVAGSDTGVCVIISEDEQQAELIFPSSTEYDKNTLLEKSGDVWALDNLSLQREGDKLVVKEGDKVLYATGEEK